jgi:cyclophilin family peptidyl-prolyl cis-trans isomerase
MCQAKPAAKPPTPPPTASALPTVCVITDKGESVLALEPAKAPGTVDNFLRYVNQGFYDQTVFHRFGKDGFGFAQGGGFTYSGSSYMPKSSTQEAIALESTLGSGLSNTAGTIAMARTNDPDSATAGFFVNTINNSSSFDSRSKRDGYAVFGSFIYGAGHMDGHGRLDPGHLRPKRCDRAGHTHCAAMGLPDQVIPKAAMTEPTRPDQVGQTAQVDTQDCPSCPNGTSSSPSGPHCAPHCGRLCRTRGHARPGAQLDSSRPRCSAFVPSARPSSKPTPRPTPRPSRHPRPEPESPAAAAAAAAPAEPPAGAAPEPAATASSGSGWLAPDSPLLKPLPDRAFRLSNCKGFFGGVPMGALGTGALLVAGAAGSGAPQAARAAARRPPPSADTAAPALQGAKLNDSGSQLNLNYNEVLQQRPARQSQLCG